MYKLRLEGIDLCAFLLYALHYGSGVAVGYPHRRPHVNVGSDIYRAVGICAHGTAEDHCIVMLVKQGKFKGIIEKVLIVSYIKIFAVYLVSGYAVKFFYDCALGACNGKISAQRLLARDIQ